VFVPFFVVVSGMSLDISAFASVGGIVRTLVFLGLMLVARGVPALVLYRPELDATDRRALALLSATQLPLVLAITTLAVSTGRMTSSLAADLVGAAVLSTLFFPLAGLRLRHRDRTVGSPHAPTGNSLHRFCTPRARLGRVRGLGAKL
jgi:Kef-type K+ transport system membrane component KefB